MRMVYTHAPEEIFLPARDRLVRRFAKWARRRGESADPFVVEVLLEHRWSHGDGLLGRWQPEDLHEALLDRFPRTVTFRPREWDCVLPTVRAFIDFLFDQDLADRRCADRNVLHTALDKLSSDFEAAMADETRYGPAKFCATRMLRDGVDPTDPAAAEAFIADLHAGRYAVDEALLSQVMANYLHHAEPDEPPPLPLVLVPDDDQLRALAGESITVRRLQQLVDWVGDGRTLTATGRVTLADARELVELLETGDVIDPAIGDREFKTRSSEELYELSVVVAWARAARVVRVVKGRLVRVKSAAKVVADPLVLARRAYSALFELGEAVCGRRYLESVLRWRFDDALVAASLALFTAPEPVPIREIRHLTYDVACASLLFEPGTDEQERVWRDLAGKDTDRMLDQLASLGTVELRGGLVTATPLGIGLIAGYLRELGATVPGVDDFLDETAEVVVCVAADSAPQAAAALLNAWCAHNTATARADLRALAARTDDRRHRRLAAAYANGS